jgi:hypothetical protein
MSLNQFMNENLGVIREEIIRNIPNPEFDSHEFIRHFAKKFEITYVEFLGSYKLEPFRNVHAQIGRFLSEHQELLKIKDNGTAQSPNIFGIQSPNEKWVKTDPRSSAQMKFTFRKVRTGKKVSPA